MRMGRGSSFVSLVSPADRFLVGACPIVANGC